MEWVEKLGSPEASIRQRAVRGLSARLQARVLPGSALAPMAAELGAQLGASLLCDPPSAPAALTALRHLGALPGGAGALIDSGLPATLAKFLLSPLGGRSECGAAAEALLASLSGGGNGAPTAAGAAAVAAAAGAGAGAAAVAGGPRLRAGRAAR